MDRLGQWGFEWRCEGVFALAELAIRIDLERATLLKENEREMVERLAALTGDDEIAAEMAAWFRSPGMPLVTDLHDIPRASGGGVSLRYGGYPLPVAARIERAFAGRN